MKKIYNNISEIIGNTPMLEPLKLAEKIGIKANIFLKLEYLNPTGSIKDRAAKEIIEDAEKKGLLKAEATIIEPTSGNTGIGLAAIGASKGYRVLIVMPETMSEERRKIITALGAEVILTDGKSGMAGAVQKAEDLKSEIKDSIIAGQFVNEANVNAHYKTTGPEIWEDMDGKVDIFISGIGTGGTVSGTGRYLKEKNSNIKIIGIEPENSAVISGEKAGKHGIQGIGAGFIPDIMDLKLLDEIYLANDRSAIEASKMLASFEGIMTGISSGAALACAIEQAKKTENEGKNIVVILPDSADRYFSTELF